MEETDTPVFLSPGSKVTPKGFGGVTNQRLHESFTENSREVKDEKRSNEKECLSSYKALFQKQNLARILLQPQFYEVYEVHRYSIVTDLLRYYRDELLMLQKTQNPTTVN